MRQPQPRAQCLQGCSRLVDIRKKIYGKKGSSPANPAYVFHFLYIYNMQKNM
nr:MAG TPA: hypothetical protein [Caudoviricetes sp.]